MSLSVVGEKLYWWSNKRKLVDLHRVTSIYVFVFVVWGLYRLLFRLPEWFEETVLKALVFGMPVMLVVYKLEKKDWSQLGMVTRGLLSSLYFGLLFGLWLAVLGNIMAFLRDGGVRFNPDMTVAAFGDLMLLGLVTAFWEQLLFMGYFLPRVVKDIGSELAGVALVALMFALLHVPIQVAQGVELPQIIIRFILLYSLGFGNGVLYLRLKN
ncbi:type II CAAX prenyl endopeptidase Rce1 family protein, partial [Pseudomonadota bacterium]